MSYLSWIILALVILVVLIVIIGWWYERATNEVSLVKTGLGGRSVVIDGGTIVVPFFNTVTRVNMQTLRIPVARSGSESLITKDKMRVDVGTEFYVSVVPKPDAIARAVQTLGDRTFNADQLGALIEGMFVDALRSGAARLLMDELHENRSDFVHDVGASLAEPLSRYGLQVDSVSLISFDQTPFDSLDENNAFNAEGMLKLAEVIAASKRERAQIESDTVISVRQSEMEAYRRKLTIELEERRSEIAQTQEVEALLAEQLVDVAHRKAEAEKAAAQSRLSMEQAIEEAALRKEQSIRETEIDQAHNLEIVEQDRRIEISAKQVEGTRALAQSKQAEKHLIDAEESLETQRKMAEAERKKSVSLIAAAQDAETESLRQKTKSDTDKLTAVTQFFIEREEAETRRVAMQAEADGTAAQIAAENTRSPDLNALEMERTRLSAMPGIVREMVKPAEKIDSIQVHQISGLSKSGDGGSGDQGSRGSSPVDQAVNAIMDLAVTMPTLKQLGDKISGETSPRDEEENS